MDQQSEQINSNSKKKMKTETDSENIEMYKLWINEATENIKTHYQNKLKKKRNQSESLLQK